MFIILFDTILEEEYCKKRNLDKSKYISKYFWVIFFLFLFIPLMNTVMGDTASLSMVANMLPELILILVIIVLSNITRFIMKIIYFGNGKENATLHNQSPKTSYRGIANFVGRDTKDTELLFGKYMLNSELLSEIYENMNFPLCPL